MSFELFTGEALTSVLTDHHTELPARQLGMRGFGISK